MNAPVDVIDNIKFLKNIFVKIELKFRKTNYQPVLKAFVPTLENSHKQWFQKRRSPAGTPWTPLANSTIHRKGRDQPLIDSTRLVKSLSNSGAAGAIRQTTKTRLIFGTNVAYSSLHNTGTGLIPQREHVGMDNDTLQILVDAVTQASVKQLKE